MSAGTCSSAILLLHLADTVPQPLLVTLHPTVILESQCLQSIPVLRNTSHLGKSSWVNTMLIHQQFHSPRMTQLGRTVYCTASIVILYRIKILVHHKTTSSAELLVSTKLEPQCHIILIPHSQILVVKVTDIIPKRYNG